MEQGNNNATEGQQVQQQSPQAQQPIQQQAQQPQQQKEEQDVYMETINRWMAKLEARLTPQNSNEPSISDILNKEDQAIKEQQELDELRNYKKEVESLKAIGEAQKVLQERGLPIFIADKIIGETAEDTTKNIKAFQKLWNKELDAAVNERLSKSGFKVKPSSDESLQKLSSQELITKLSKGEINFDQYWNLVKDSKQ